MILATHGIVQSGAALNPAAQAFITATGITNPTQIAAINTLVIDLQGYGLWSKMKAVYPFVGGTATTHKYNLVNPVDTDAAYRLVFNGGWTHSSTGATPNGTNGYANTYLIPSSVLTANNNHISVYLRDNTNGVFCDMGQEGAISAYQITVYPRLSDIAYNDLGAQLATRTTYANTDSRGQYILSRTSSTSFKAYKNNVLKNTNTNTNTASFLTHSIFISANNSTGTAIQFSNRQTAFASIGDGLTDTEASNFYTSVQAYQTTLSRQV